MWERAQRPEILRHINPTFMYDFSKFYITHAVPYLSFPAPLLTPCVVYFDGYVVKRRYLKSNLSLSSKLQGNLCVKTNVGLLFDYKIPHLCERLLLYFEGLRLKEGTKHLSDRWVC